MNKSFYLIEEAFPGIARESLFVIFHAMLFGTF